MIQRPLGGVVAFFCASSIMALSVPDQRTRHLLEASQKARPNVMPGTQLRYRYDNALLLLTEIENDVVLVDFGLELVDLRPAMAFVRCRIPDADAQVGGAVFEGIA